MLNISADDIEEMRIRLLAAVATGSLSGDQAQHAIEAAEHLTALSTHAFNEGSTWIDVAPKAIGDLLVDLAKKAHGI